MLRQLDLFVPEIQAIHPMSCDAPEECVALFMNVFRTLQMGIQYRVPSYVDRMLHEDAASAYQGYRQQLQLILSHRPGGERLLLKDPTHTVHLATLLDVFPDARVIFTHRDPTRSISSICSLYPYSRAVFDDSVDPVEIGQEIIGGYWPDAMISAQSERKRLAPGAVADVRQRDLVEDPIATVASVYRALGIDLTEAARSAMQRFVLLDAQTPKRRHEHRLEGFGLEEGAVRERFKAYCEAFDV